jgi:EAL domain-containing protein (putative c-di-GMP-specific phosphodiesterase class I)
MFIPIAEEVGLISELSESLIAAALEYARHWAPHLTLAVNISPIQLRDPWFSQRLLKLLVAANFPPGRLEIEITESCMHEDIVQVRTLIASLKNQGVRVSLDDFGTGYNSLSQLHKLPFDRIKIDRSFVRGIDHCPDSAAIVESIAMLGKGLGLPITAEGIETDAVLDRLREFGALRGQGYLYGKPHSADETHKLLQELGLISEELKVPVVAAVKPASEAASDASAGSRAAQG